MVKQSSAKKTFTNDRYWSGIFTGIMLGSFFIVAIIVIFVGSQGLKVVINPAQLASLVQSKIQTETKQEIPAFLEGIKHELPNRIADHLDGLADLTLSFGESEVKLPPEVLATVKTEFDRIIEEAIINTLNDYDTSKVEEKIGKNTYETVLRLLNQEIIGKTYLVKTSNWLVIPVKIVGSSHVNLRIGI